jgi:nicotinamidase-related amidase
MEHTFANHRRAAALTPENCVFLLIDHQPLRLAKVNGHDHSIVIHNVTELAKTAKAFGVPTILSAVNAGRGSAIFSQLQAVFPNQKPLNRAFINAWADPRVVDLVASTGRRKIVIAALWTEMCLALPAVQAMGDGYDVYVVTDASGGATPASHDIAIRCLAAVGARPITSLAVAGELQRGCPGTLREHAHAQ